MDQSLHVPPIATDLEQACGLDNDAGDTVRIYVNAHGDQLSRSLNPKREVRTNVGSRATILEVPVALGTNMSGNTNRSTTVGDTTREGTDVASLVSSSQSEIVVLAVHSDVVVVPLGKFLDGTFDCLHASRLTHLLGGVVGVAAGTIPVTLEGLGVEGNLDIPLLGNTDKEVAGHPEVVTHGDTLARSDLEFPLRRHHLGVDTRDVDTGVEAGAVVSLDEITGEHLASTCQED